MQSSVVQLLEPLGHILGSSYGGIVEGSLSVGLHLHSATHVPMISSKIGKSLEKLVTWTEGHRRRQRCVPHQIRSLLDPLQSKADDLVYSFCYSSDLECLPKANDGTGRA